MKYLKSTFIAGTTSILLLSGSAYGALTLTFDDTSGNTVVTLTGNEFTVDELEAQLIGPSSNSTYISPSRGRLAFTGTTDVITSFDLLYTIPNFTLGAGSTDTAASDLSSSNPYIGLLGDLGLLILSSSNPIPSNFTATATYSGDLAANGIDSTSQAVTFSDGQVLTISVIPEPSSALLIGLGILGIGLRRRRTN